MIKNQKSLSLIMMVGLSAMLIIRDVGQINISKFILLAFIVLFLALANYETTVNMLCFIFPLLCGLPGTYIIACALVLLVLKKNYMNKWQIGFVLFVAAMECVASIWYPSTDLSSLVQYIAFAGLMFYLIYDDKKIDYLKCIESFLWGTFLVCAVIVTTGIMHAPGNWISLFAQGYFRFGATQTSEMEGMILMLNANSLGYFSAVGMCCGILLAERYSGIRRMVYVMFSVFVSIVGFLTVSRSWLVVASLCLIIYVASKVKNIKVFASTISLVLVIILIAGIYLSSHLDFIQGFILRFTSDDLEGGNGRVDIFLEYMDAFFSSPRFVLMGTGITQAASVAGIKYGFHNGTQQILVGYGIIGFFIFIGGLFNAVTMTLKDNKKGRSIVNWLPLISVIVFVQALQFLNPMMLMFPFVIGVFALKLEEPVTGQTVCKE